MCIYTVVVESLLYSEYAIIMENVGSLDRAKTKFMNLMYVYHCVRKPGFLLEFTAYKDKLFRCAGCKRLGKSRYISIENDAVLSTAKHPEDDHVCEPIAAAGIYTTVKNISNLK